MIALSDYRIAADARWWYLHGPRMQVIRRFRTDKWTHAEVKAWRAGYLRGLQASLPEAA